MTPRLRAPTPLWGDSGALTYPWQDSTIPSIGPSQHYRAQGLSRESWTHPQQRVAVCIVVPVPNLEEGGLLQHSRAGISERLRAFL